MYQLHLGIGPGLEKQLRAWAEARDLSIAAAVRLILREHLTENQPKEIQR